MHARRWSVDIPGWLGMLDGLENRFVSQIPPILGLIYFLGLAVPSLFWLVCFVLCSVGSWRASDGLRVIDRAWSSGALCHQIGKIPKALLSILVSPSFVITFELYDTCRQ
jgi:hypothetical protein